MYDLPNLDFDVVSDGDFEPIPDGKYLAEIQAAEIKDFRDDGELSIRVQFGVIDGDYKKRVISAFWCVKDNQSTHDGKLSKKVYFGLSRLKELALAAANGDKEKAKMFNKLKEGFLLEKVVVIDVDINEHRGNRKNTINRTFKKADYKPEATPTRQEDNSASARDDITDEGIPF